MHRRPDGFERFRPPKKRVDSEMGEDERRRVPGQIPQEFG
jgi:hypothetical protein